MGKRLGRLEISGVKMADQLVNLTDRCGFVAEALVDEHEEREIDKTRISHLESVVAKLEKIVNKIYSKIKRGICGVYNIVIRRSMQAVEGIFYR